MKKRIYPFKPCVNATQLIRPRLVRSVNIVLDEFPKPCLTRQTNEHECLPHELWLRWWMANSEEKNNIFMEYEATTW